LRATGVVRAAEAAGVAAEAAAAAAGARVDEPVAAGVAVVAAGRGGSPAAAAERERAAEAPAEMPADREPRGTAGCARSPIDVDVVDLTAVALLVLAAGAGEADVAEPFASRVLLSVCCRDGMAAGVVADRPLADVDADAAGCACRVP
jgi:hypothetical protein